MKPKQEITFPFWILCLIITISALGWLFASFFFGKIQHGDLAKVVGGLGIEVFKTIFIASSVGIALNLYLKKALGETPMSILQKSGINEIFPSRLSAEIEFRQLVNNKKIKRIDIAGISLRDFLTGGGKLRDIWSLICDRLEEEENEKKSEKNRLHIRLLLLNHRSSEGLFRHEVEKDTIGEVGLPIDVPTGFEEVFQSQQNIYKSNSNEFLQIRLYDHCPFAFMLATDTKLFIEQYYYKDHRKRVNLPLMQYRNDTPQYGELLNSFNTIWKHATPEKPLRYNVGTAAAINEARINNIFRKEERNWLSEREIECLNFTKPGERVDILAISGKFGHVLI